MHSIVKNVSNVSTDDSQSVLRSLSTLMCINIINLTRSMMLLVTNHLRYVWGLPNYFPNSFVDFYGFQVFWLSDMRKNEA